MKLILKSQVNITPYELVTLVKKQLPGYNPVLPQEPIICEKTIGSYHDAEMIPLEFLITQVKDKDPGLRISFNNSFERSIGLEEETIEKLKKHSIQNLQQLIVAFEEGVLKNHGLNYGDYEAVFTLISQIKYLFKK